MRRLPFVIAVLLCAGASRAADPPRFPWPQIRWEAPIDGTPDGTGVIRAVLVDARDAVIVAGTMARAEGEATRSVPLVAKYGPSGRRLWMANALGRTPAAWGEVRLATVHENREITVWGATGDIAGDPEAPTALTRFGPDGSIRWTRSLTVPGAAGFEPAAMAAVPGGGFAMAGTARRPDAVNQPEWCLVLLDSRGRVLWMRMHDGRTTGEKEACGVAADPAGDLIVLGRGAIGGGSDRWLVEGWTREGRRSMSAWGDGDPGCVRQMAGFVSSRGRGCLVAGDQVCEGKTAAVFVRRLDRNGAAAWTAAAPTPGRIAALCVLPGGGAVMAGEERDILADGGPAWPVAMRWNSQGDLVMACRGLRKDETSARFTAAAADSEGSFVVAGESTTMVKGSVVRRLFVRKLAF